MEPFVYRSANICTRHKLFGMTYRCYHAKHLKITKMYPGIVSVAEGKTPQITRKSEGQSEDPSMEEAVCNSQKLMLQNHLIVGGATGTYTATPPLTRSLEKLQKVIDQEMQNIGAQKIAMPCLVSGSLWKKSGRWNIMGPELIKLKDRHEKDLCLSPTHEEIITSMIAMDANLSLQKMPLKLYQIGRKFRDERRPKHGLLRAREFEMKDLYTFDVEPEQALETYEEVCEAYSTTFERLNLNVMKVQAATGAIGGSHSHEFHLPTPIGEDTLLKCPQCDSCLNEELEGTLEDSTAKCSREDCPGVYNKISGIEVAHAFVLGTKYSQIFKAKVFNTHRNAFTNYHMGCYGIGLTRLLAGSVEILSTDTDIRWPSLIAPYQICIISQQTGYYFEESLAIATSLQEELLSVPNLRDEVVLDDRHKLSIGKRIKQCYQAGFPHIIVIGKKIREEPPLFEYHDVTAGEIHLWNKEQILDKVSQITTIAL